jgi:hypothetical protein|tara:strand:- start:785 stop:1051 length:267 start_codon:yes stop_codon:yes gene_type:complete
MEKKDNFGEMLAKILNIGDLVQWSKWNSENSEWKEHYGIISSIKNEIKANRMVSISRVIPIQDQSLELEFFTISLRLISPIKNKQIIQ